MVELFPPVVVAPTVLSAPIEFVGNWGHVLPRSAKLVLERMRHPCLDGVCLVSDRQPTRLRVDEHTSGPPAVCPDGSSMACIIVGVGDTINGRPTERHHLSQIFYSAELGV
jgi:hypothetical protein